MEIAVSHGYLCLGFEYERWQTKFNMGITNLRIETNKIEELILEKTCRLQKSTKDSGQTFSTMFLMITL